MALRESVVNVIDGVWYLLVYLAGTVFMFIGFDWRLMVPLTAWLIAYAVVIATLVPPVRAALDRHVGGEFGPDRPGRRRLHQHPLGKALRACRARGGVRARGLPASARRGARHEPHHHDHDGGADGSEFRLHLRRRGLSIWLWTRGEITLGAIAAANALTLRLNQMSGWVLRSITTLFESTGTIENGMELLSRPNTLVDPPGAEPLIVTEGRDRLRGRYLPLRRRKPRDPRPVALHPPGREGRARRPVGRRQVDARESASALLQARTGAHPDRRPGYRRA